MFDPSILCISMKTENSARGPYSPSQVESSRSGSLHKLVLESQELKDKAPSPKAHPELLKLRPQREVFVSGSGVRSSRLDQGPVQSRKLLPSLRCIRKMWFNLPP